MSWNRHADSRWETISQHYNGCSPWQLLAWRLWSSCQSEGANTNQYRLTGPVMPLWRQLSQGGTRPKIATHLQTPKDWLTLQPGYKTMHILTVQLRQKWHTVLISIENKLAGLDIRITLIEVLHREFQALHQSLEFSQDQIDTLTRENSSLQHSVNTLTIQLTSVVTKEKDNSVLCSLGDNLAFTSTCKQTSDDPEQ